MIDPEHVLKARWRWVEMYERTQNAALTCRRCGIAKATLLKWRRRYQGQGEAGLCSQSRRPHKLRERKVTPEHEALILELRRTRYLGPILRAKRSSARVATPAPTALLHTHDLEGAASSRRLCAASHQLPSPAQALHPPGSRGSSAS